jgi:2-polyprenyl-3-methyl-5-hydroxy-6-metoxy-1,4-benzoquinol methylase
MNPASTNFLSPARRFDPAITELMDRSQQVSEELEDDLKNLEKLNRYFGSYSLVRFFLRRWLSRRKSVRLLDLCTGFGDIPRFIVDWCRLKGIPIEITAVDLQPATLELAKRWSGAYPEITFVAGNVLDFLPLSPVDLVFCSLALHHFSDEEAIRLIRQTGLMTSGNILFSDLERSDLGIIGIYALTTLVFREPMTRFDGRLSMRRAFSFAEMDRLTHAAGWRRFDHRRFLICRQAIWREA